MLLLSAVVIVFAVISVLWFGLSFAISAQLIADGSLRNQIHLVFGYATATVEAATVAGWLWALFMSARAGSPVNGPVQIMCGATATAQVSTTLAMVILMGGWLWDGPTGFFLGYAAVAALLAVMIGRSRRRLAAGGG